ncbi:MAG: DUF4397 domain-containing protein [Bacteroidetes bacterium]|jgi:hypothetical protein|nr:DUF4397 domain-containing protein [Bacteroidota bacterium]
MKDVLAVLFTMLLAVTLVGCDSNDDNGDDQPETAQVRFVHAAPDAGDVDVFLDDQEVAGDFSYKAPTPADVEPNYSDYLDVPVDVDARIDVRPTDSNENLLTVNVDQANLNANARYTVIVGGAQAANTEAPQIILLRDQFVDLPANSIGLRLVHASAIAQDNAGPVDVYITPPGTDLSQVDPLIPGFEFTQDSGTVSLGTSGAFIQRELSGEPQVVSVTAAGSAQAVVQVQIGGDGGLQISEGQFVTGIAADIPAAEGGLGIGAQAIIESAPSN